MSSADVKEYRRRAERMEADWNLERDRRQAAEAEVEHLTERAERAERRVTELSDDLDFTDENLEKAEAALARVEAAGIPVGREVLEDAIDHVEYFITERLGNERSVQGAKVLKSQLREAMEGTP